jgi:hypothetical protein
MIRIGWELPLDLGRKAEPALRAARLRGELASLLMQPALRRHPLFCVSTVSIVCTLKVPVPIRAEDG